MSIRSYGARKSFGSSGTSNATHPSRTPTILEALKTACNVFLPWKWFRFAILPNNVALKVVTVACLLASYFDVITIIYTFVTRSKDTAMLHFSLVFESVFYLRIFLSFHQAYMDRHGNYVFRNKQIVRHYFKDCYQVFWDATANFPVEPFCLLFEDRLVALSSLRLMHLLRAEFVLRHFNKANKVLLSNFALNQLLRIALFSTVALHVFSCAWLMLACPFGSCGNDTWASSFNFAQQSPLQRYMVSFYYVLSIATTTGIGDVYPKTNCEILFSVVVMLICRFGTALVIADIVTIINNSSNGLAQYEYRIRKLQDFLRNQNLSDHQMGKLWAYVKNMWREEKGQHIPTMLQLCPYVLKCDIMTTMFGQHLRNSFLFKGVNEDLLRQVAVRLDRTVFLQGHYIVQHGDTNQNMYFIHYGEVSVLTVRPNLTETQHEVLRTNDMFGLAQGLYHGLPHHFSFRASTKVSILVLNLDSWHHMLKYFPADKELIYDRVQTLYVRM